MNIVEEIWGNIAALVVLERKRDKLSTSHQI